MSYLKNFLIPLVLGIMLGFILKTYDQQFLIKLVAQLSEIILSFINYFVPVMVFIYISSAIINFNGNLNKFLTKYIFVLVSSLLVCVAFTTSIVLLVVPYLVSEVSGSSQMYIDPFFNIPSIKYYNAFSAIILAFIFAILTLKFNVFKKSLATKMEHKLEIFIKKIFIKVIPYWIICSFAVSTFERNGIELIKMDILLSILVISLQIIWLLMNYLISTKFVITRFRKVLKSATKIYVSVTSMAGMGTGVIVPIIIKEQEEIGYDKQKAKFISVTSFNMPGSLIANLVFSYGVIILYNFEVSNMQFIIYAISLAFVLIIAPALPGAVFVVSSQLLNPLLGFNDAAISLLSGFYFRQGTSNSAVNNCADFYMAGYLDEKDRSKNEKFSDTLRN